MCCGTDPYVGEPVTEVNVDDKLLLWKSCGYLGTFLDVSAFIAVICTVLYRK